MVTKRLYEKEKEWSRGQIKTCRKTQHVKIDNMKEMPNSICGNTAVGGNYNSTCDNLITLGEVIDKQPTFGEWTLIKDDVPPDNVEVLFKTRKNGRKYVGKKKTFVHYDGSNEFEYRCITARGSEVTGLKPIAWMYLPD